MESTQSWAQPAGSHGPGDSGEPRAAPSEPGARVPGGLSHRGMVLTRIFALSTPMVR
jgi:hypothetical protein